jgi:rhodanese-related sulfurtransferase
MKPSKKNLLQVLVVTLAALVFGLGRNYLSQTPLPLFKGFEKKVKAERNVDFTEVDADFVGQLNVGAGTVLLDARPQEIFRGGHIPGAVSLPVGRFDLDFPFQREQLQVARLLVVYCSGPNCGDAQALAVKLREKGFKDLLLYRGGVEDWLETGHALVR